MQDPKTFGAVDQNGNPAPGLVAYEAEHGPIEGTQEVEPAPRGKNREDLVDDYRKELARGGWPREQRRRLVIQFRKELTKRGEV